MLKKLLRTSILTLGAGLYALATFQNECHATVFDNETWEPVTVYTRVSLRYTDVNNQLATLIQAPEIKSEVHVGQGEKANMAPPEDLAQRQEAMRQSVLAKGGTDLTWVFRIEAQPDSGRWAGVMNISVDDMHADQVFPNEVLLNPNTLYLAD